MPLWGFGVACSLGLFIFTFKFLEKLGERFLDIIDGKNLKEIFYENYVTVEKHYEEVNKDNVWRKGIRHNFYNGYRIHKGDLFFDGKGNILTAIRATDKQIRNYWEGHQLNEGDLFVDDKDGEILIATRVTDEQLKEF